MCQVALTGAEASHRRGFAAECIGCLPKFRGKEAAMKILVAVDGSSPSQEAIDEVAHRPWPQSSIVRVVSAVRPYVPSAIELVPAAVTPADVTQQQEEQAKRLTSQAADRIGK